MTREELIELAKQCGYWSGETIEMNDVGLERFATLVAAAEREECIRIVENEAYNYTSPVWAFEIVNDMKDRGEKK